TRGRTKRPTSSCLHPSKSSTRRCSEAQRLQQTAIFVRVKRASHREGACRLTVAEARPVVPTSFHALPRRDLILTVAGLMMGLLLAALDQTIVGTAMPRIVAELHGFEHYA